MPENSLDHQVRHTQAVEIADSPATISTTANWISVHPSGRFAYAALNGGIQQYPIDPVSGVLTASGSAADASFPFASMAISPSGAYLYAVAEGGVFIFSIDPSSGALTLASSMGTRQQYPQAVAIDISGQYLYSSGPFGGSLDIFSVNSSNGSLTLVTTLPVAPSGFALTGTVQ